MEFQTVYFTRKFYKNDNKTCIINETNIKFMKRIHKEKALLYDICNKYRYTIEYCRNFHKSPYKMPLYR